MKIQNGPLTFQSEILLKRITAEYKGGILKYEKFAPLSKESLLNRPYATEIINNAKYLTVEQINALDSWAFERLYELNETLANFIIQNSFVFHPSQIPDLCSKITQGFDITNQLQALERIIEKYKIKKLDALSEQSISINPYAKYHALSEPSLLNRPYAIEIINISTDLTIEQINALGSLNLLYRPYAIEIINRAKDLTSEQINALGGLNLLDKPYAIEILDRAKDLTIEQINALGSLNLLDKPYAIEILDRAKDLTAQQINALGSYDFQGIYKNNETLAKDIIQKAHLIEPSSIQDLLSRINSHATVNNLLQAFEMLIAEHTTGNFQDEQFNILSKPSLLDKPYAIEIIKRAKDLTLEQIDALGSYVFARIYNNNEILAKDIIQKAHLIEPSTIKNLFMGINAAIKNNLLQAFEMLIAEHTKGNLQDAQFNVLSKASLLNKPYAIEIINRAKDLTVKQIDALGINDGLAKIYNNNKTLAMHLIQKADLLLPFQILDLCARAAQDFAINNPQLYQKILEELTKRNPQVINQIENQYNADPELQKALIAALQEENLELSFKREILAKYTTQKNIPESEALSWMKHFDNNSDLNDQQIYQQPEDIIENYIRSYTKYLENHGDDLSDHQVDKLKKSIKQGVKELKDQAKINSEELEQRDKDLARTGEWYQKLAHAIKIPNKLLDYKSIVINLLIKQRVSMLEELNVLDNETTMELFKQIDNDDCADYLKTLNNVITAIKARPWNQDALITLQATEELLAGDHSSHMVAFCKQYILKNKDAKSKFKVDLWKISQDVYRKTYTIEETSNNTLIHQNPDMQEDLNSPAMIIFSEKCPDCYKILTELPKPLLSRVITPISSLLESLLEQIIAKTGLAQNKDDLKLLSAEHKGYWDLLDEKIMSCIAGAKSIDIEESENMYKAAIDRLISAGPQPGYNFWEAFNKIVQYISDNLPEAAVKINDDLQHEEIQRAFSGENMDYDEQ